MKIALCCLLATIGLYAQTNEGPATTESPAEVAVAGTLSFKGRILEKGTQLPLKEVNVFLLPLKLKVQTDSKGDFLFENLPPGDYQLVVNLSGYKKLEKDITLDESTKKLKHYVEKDSYLAFETTVVGQKQKRDQTQKTLTQEQFLSMPGSGGDPVKAVQNLPGVNRVQGFSSQVVVQGGEPKDTSYNIDGHEIPIVFHFGGLTSVVMPEALGQVDYLSAGYGSDFSRATGGIIGLVTRSPEPGERKKKSFFFADNLKLGGLYEANIDDKSDFLISARASYVGIFLGAIAKDRDDFNLTVAPEFYDITGIYNRKLDEKQNLKIVKLASRDTLAFVLKEPFKTDPAFRGRFYNETQFYRFIPQWTYKVDSETQYKFSTGVGQNQIVVDLGEQYLAIRTNVLTVRAEGEKVFSPTWTSQLGIDSFLGEGTAKVKISQTADDGGVNNPFSSGEVKEQNTRSSQVFNGLYNRHEFKIDDWTLTPGVRLDMFQSTKETYLTPRLAVKYNLSPSLLLKAAGGRYYQPSEGREQDKVFGNPDIKSPRADHLTVGFEKDFRQAGDSGLTWQTSYFDKWLDQLVSQSFKQVERDGVMVDENYNNSGRGRAYGVETQIKWNDIHWDVWLSYTWSESFRWNDRVAKYKHEYDQTHNFNLVAGKKLENNWKIAGRFRYVTGNPYTPIVGGTFDSDNDVYLPQRGSFYSERYKDFYQLDLRIDKKWISDEEIWTLYLDIQNVMNTKNTESIEYSYNYSSKDFISGLPFLPAFGIKGEF
tara:strand:+ start:23656 stop:25950 length:2295 start_codon:yes stop_codon:yes gene_type:complete